MEDPTMAGSAEPGAGDGNHDVTEALAPARDCVKTHFWTIESI
jgi:hypothetical protein